MCLLPHQVDRTSKETAMDVPLAQSSPLAREVVQSDGLVSADKVPAVIDEVCGE